MDKRNLILCTIVAMLLLLLLSHSSKNNGNHCYRHRRFLLLRSDCTLTGDYNQHIPDSHADHTDSDFSNTNVHIFPDIDVEPTDWFFSHDELTQWSFKQAQREMKFHDKNHDGFVSFSESGPPSWLQEDNGGDCWWKEEHFNASDADGDGFLNLTEFNDFLNPAESNNPKLQQWLCREEVRERDMDRDGKISFNEFFRWLLVRSYDEGSNNDSDHSDDSMDNSARVLFSQLDNDGDGYLSDKELLPIIGKLHPSSHHYAKQQAEYVISQAEVDKDGSLTLTLMIKNPYLFYNAIFNNDKDEYDGSHDEVF